MMINSSDTFRGKIIDNACVAYVDMLGTTEKTKVVDEEMFRQGRDLSTVWWFLAHIAKTDEQLSISGVSDSLLMIRHDFEKLVPLLIALFQISFITRGFRIRAGVEIGSVYGPDDFHDDFIPFIKENELTNITVPKYIIGDAITGAVLAERKLKGSRIVVGPKLEKRIKIKGTKLGNIFINRESENVMEIKWIDSTLTDSIFNELNETKKFTRPYPELIKNRFNSFLQNPDDDYSKIMIGLGVEWGILPKEEQ